MSRILLIAHGYPFEKIGGVGQVILQLLEQLPTLGWQVHVLVPVLHSNSKRRLLLHQFKIRLLPKGLKSHFNTLLGKKYTRKATVHIESTRQSWGILHQLHRQPHTWSEAWHDLETIDQLNKWFKQESFVQVHVHHLNGIPFQWISELPRNIKLHITLHDYAIPCARGQLLNRNLTICNTVNLQDCRNCIDHWLKLETQPESAIAQRMDLALAVLNRANRIDAPSLDMIGRFQTLYPNIHIEHCLLPFQNHTHHIEAKPKHPHRYIFIGSIHPSKGVHLLLQAFRKLQQLDPTAELTIIGHPSSSDILPNFEQTWMNFAQNLPNVRWLGERTHAETIREMQAHHTFVLPSIWPENSPITIREALSLRLHIICGEGGSSELSKTILRTKNGSVHSLFTQMIAVQKAPQPSNTHFEPASRILNNWIGSP